MSKELYEEIVKLPVGTAHEIFEMVSEKEFPATRLWASQNGPLHNTNVAMLAAHSGHFRLHYMTPEERVTFDRLIVSFREKFSSAGVRPALDSKVSNTLWQLANQTPFR